MNKDWKFTWEIEIDNKIFTRETHKNFDVVKNARSFLFKVKQKGTDKEFFFPVQPKQRPVFFRKVYGACGLNTMYNKIVMIVYCFGVEAEDGTFKNIVWECNDKLYFVDNIDKYVRLG